MEIKKKYICGQPLDETSRTHCKRESDEWGSCDLCNPFSTNPNVPKEIRDKIHFHSSECGYESMIESQEQNEIAD